MLVDGATLYRTYSPCFGCLEEAVQAGITRVVYGEWYLGQCSAALIGQYRRLAEHLAGGDPTRFEKLGGDRPPYEGDPEPPTSSTSLH